MRLGHWYQAGVRGYGRFSRLCQHKHRTPAAAVFCASPKVVALGMRTGRMRWLQVYEIHRKPVHGRRIFRLHGV